MKLIIESGATKSDWRLTEKGKQLSGGLFHGMNVSSMPMGKVLGVMDEALAHFFPEGGELEGIYLYLAGIATPAIREQICERIRSHVRTGEIDIQNDLCAAARAVCGHGSGVVAIMGTGSNSCFYDGDTVSQRVRSGGFIIGDEGGAAALGKLFLADLIKERIPEAVAKEFDAQFDASYGNIVEKIYHGERPAAWLGSLAPFIVSHADDPAIKALVERNFRDFIERTLLRYPVRELGLGAVGGFGYACRGIFSSLAAEYGFKVNKYLPEPVEGLLEYHR